MSDTVFALSSGRGRAGVAVIRLSGPDAGAALCALTRKEDLPPARLASLRSLYDPQNGDVIDQALVLYFPGPRSFTGEDVVELQVHAGPAVLSAVLEALALMPGLRPAEAGEFTRRAFQHGRMDLTEVEGLSDLLAAETAAQRRQALDQMGGSLGRLYQGWADGLTRSLAYLEAAIDFVDEEDIPDHVDREARETIADLIDAINAHLSDGHRGERLREGLRVAVLGAPNAGKSSLVNALAGRDVAIVTAQAGTTRDVIEIRLDLKGWPVLMADTAGLRETLDIIEQEGVARARAWSDEADLHLLVIDLAEGQIPAEIIDLITENSLLVLNKYDLAGQASGNAGSAEEAFALLWANTPGCSERQPPRPLAVLYCAAKEEQGLAELCSAIETQAERMLSSAQEASGPLLTRPRHRAALADCLHALERAGQAPLAELMVEEVRLAVRALGRITGRVDVEDLLDVIFRDFCIGK